MALAQVTASVVGTVQDTSGAVIPAVMATAEAPIVNTTTAATSGLVGERRVSASERAEL